jgi:hypothetical protein
VVVVVVVIASSFLVLLLLVLQYSIALDTDTFDKSKSSQMAIKSIASNPAKKW